MEEEAACMQEDPSIVSSVKIRGFRIYFIYFMVVTLMEHNN